MRIALLGANGQLGQDLTRALKGADLITLTRSDFDVVDYSRARELLLELHPDTIINTTAYHRVDECENRPETAYSVNAVAVLNLARAANDLNAAFMHISTDYVFDGASDRPYTEESIPRPLSVYGNTKLAGEFLVRSHSKKHFLVRTCGLYGKAGSRGKGGNFVETMLAKAKRGEAIQVVDDQVLTPTSTQDLAEQLALLLSTQHYGIFHVTNEGSCSWHEFAAEIFALSGVSAELTPTTSELYKAPAIRPRFSVLENANLKKLGLNRMRHWKAALAAYLGC